MKVPSWEERLALFITHLIMTGSPEPTWRTYGSAIKSVLADDGVELDMEKCHLATLIKVCKLLPKKWSSTRLPLQRGMVWILMNNLDEFYCYEKNQPYLALLFKVIVLTGYYGLFRVGEITESPHSIKLGDVKEARNKHKILVVLWSSKIHSERNRPQMVDIKPILFEPGQNLDVVERYCPYWLLRKYSKAWPKTSKSSQFFVSATVQQ